METTRLSKGTSGAGILLTLVLIVGIFYLAKPVIVPLALAVLLTFILAPIVNSFQQGGLGRVSAVLVTALLAFAVMGAVGWGVGRQINELAVDLPNHKEKIHKKIADLRGSGDGAFGKLLQMFRELDEEPPPPSSKAESSVVRKEVVIARPEPPSTFERFATSITPVLEPLATASLVVILVIFMLINREDLRNRLISLLGHGHLTGTTRALVDAAQRLSKYLLTQLLVNVGFAIVFAIMLLLLGAPYAFLWGFLIAILRFVPYIGTWLAVCFPLIISFALAPDWTQPILLLVLFALLDLLTANVVEPLFFGHSTGVSPIALLVAAAFWTWVWGPIGLVLSTPMTVCMVVLGQHIPRFKFFTLLLGNQPPLPPHLIFYQRLLAKDMEEAKQVATEQMKLDGMESVCNDVLLPALVHARRDRKQGGLNVEEEQFILQSTKEILAEVDKAEQARKMPAPSNEQAPPAPPNESETQVASVLILGCPAHHEAEELSLQMLALLMQTEGCRFEIISTRALPVEIEKRAQSEKPALVVIPIMPPGGVLQASYLCRRLRKRFKDLPLLVGYWGDGQNFDRLLSKLRSAGASYVTTSLVQTCSQIRALVSADRPVTPAASDTQTTGAR